ncbi:MAG: FHA domain-containing protein [Phycisphaerae bacterium]|nr:FHA domain-containing protein [Tepidisphaeraceae bacterium]
MHSPAPKDKLTVTWDDVQAPEVDARLKQQASAARQDELISPALNMTAGQLKSQQARRGSIWYNAPFAMAMFGLLGGLLAWGALELVQLKTVPRADYERQLKVARAELIPALEKDKTLYRSDLAAWDAYDRASTAGNRPPLPPAKSRDMIELQYKHRLAAWDESSGDNPYFKILRRDDLTAPQKEQLVAEQNATFDTTGLIANILAFGLTGMLIAVALSVAEPVIDRNYHGALVTGAVGATLGLFGGVIVSFLTGPLERLIGDGAAPETSTLSAGQLMANAIKYGVIGLFLSVAPGIVLRNLKKSSVGIAGGAIGGIIGGILFSLVDALAGSKTGARAAAYCSIGCLAGLSTGLIENAAKTGWLKVLQGLIAGKQFILYRATTFIGGAPDCHVYLFKDPQVGRRHAAVHIVPGGFDIENLPLGSATYVNGKPVARQRLRTGDQIQIGGTVFSFQEKIKEAAKQ